MSGESSDAEKIDRLRRIGKKKEMLNRPLRAHAFLDGGKKEERLLFVAFAPKASVDSYRPPSIRRRRDFPGKKAMRTERRSSEYFAISLTERKIADRLSREAGNPVRLHYHLVLGKKGVNGDRSASPEGRRGGETAARCSRVSLARSKKKCPGA